MTDETIDGHPTADEVAAMYARFHDQANLDHLEVCLLCRIRLQRISMIPPFRYVAVRDLVVPGFGPVSFEPAAGTDEIRPTPARGDLWVTTAGDLVLVCTVLRWGDVVVAPVVFDVCVADSESQVIDESISPLAVTLVVLRSVVNSVTVDALEARVMPFRPCDLLSVAVGDPGVSWGSLIVSVADRRLDARQFASDAIVRLDPIDDDDDDDDNDDDGGGDG